MMILDGSGRGFAAKVDSENRLAVEMSGGIEGASQASRAWSLGSDATATTLTVTAAGGAMFHIVKSSSAKTAIVVSDVTVSTDTAGVIYSSAIGFSGDTSDSNPSRGIPLNSGSLIQTSASVEVWDETSDGIGGLTGGAVITNAILAVGTTVVDSGGSVVLSPGGSFSGAFKGASESTFVVRFYEVSL